MSMFEMFVSYSLLVAASLSLLTYWITRKFVLKKMNRTIMKAEHNYQYFGRHGGKTAPFQPGTQPLKRHPQ